MSFQGLMLFTGCLNLCRACVHLTSQFTLRISVHVTSFLFSWYELYKTELGYTWLEIEKRCLKNTCQKIKTRCSDIQRQIQKMRKKEASSFILEYERVGRKLYTD
jgi:hypothetical protein